MTFSMYSRYVNIYIYTFCLCTHVLIDVVSGYGSGRRDPR